MSQWFSAGLQFGLGLGTAFFVVIVVMALMSGVKPKDDSDPPNGRSGVAVVTDHRTGLQYLKAPGGGLIPRMGMDGQQIREVE